MVIKKLRVLIPVLALFSCERSPVTSDEPAWQLSGDPSLVTQYDLPVDENGEHSIDKIRYNFEREQFHIEAYAMANNNPINFVVNIREKTLDKTDIDEGFIELNPSTHQIGLHSSLLRQSGGKLQEQPHGQLRLRTGLEETRTYQVKRNSWPFGMNSYTTTEGDGTITLELIAPNQTETIFALKEEYKGTSKSYSAIFSPDGRYVFVQLPRDPGRMSMGSHSFLVIGRLDVVGTKSNIVNPPIKNQETK